MSNIVWKGIDSNSIKGLIISKLSPIIKPQIRTEIIEIDGLDGDIVNELGYQSYDKELQISLSYDYDINEIIKYFNGEGNLVLSNENDKYYKAKIIDKIDYESLLRFKTATVKFHCQPFKYKLNEDKLDVSITTENSIVINNVGLEESKPMITLFGSGTVGIYVNNIQIFTYNFDEDGQVIINSELQDAYLENSLKNRNMLGEFPNFKPGENIITWSGNLTRIIIEPKSRWL